MYLELIFVSDIDISNSAWDVFKRIFFGYFIPYVSEELDSCVEK